MLTLIYLVQLVPREDHTGNIPYHHTSISSGVSTYAIYDSPKTTTLWAAAMLSFKTSPTDS